MPGPETHADVAMTDPAEIRAYYLATTDRMRDLLDALAAEPGCRWIYPELEAHLGWDTLSVRATYAASTRLVKGQFTRIPYRLCRGSSSPTGRWETWVDATQAAAIRGG